MNSRIESLGVFANQDGSVKSSRELIRKAATECLEKSRHPKSEIGVLVNVSVYRDHYFAEPAFATFLQNDLGLNHDATSGSAAKTLAFDQQNGALGFLNACQTVGALLAQGAVRAGLVVSGDALDTPLSEGSAAPGFRPVGAALLLDQAPDPEAGFYPFFFQAALDHLESYQARDVLEDKNFRLLIQKDPELERIYRRTISRVISLFLAQQRQELDSFDLLIPPQISRGFISQLATELRVAEEKMVDVTREDGDLFTSSLPFAMEHVLRNGLARPGQKALIVNVGSGLQVGCATYTF